MTAIVKATVARGRRPSATGLWRLPFTPVASTISPYSSYQAARFKPYFAPTSANGKPAALLHSPSCLHASRSSPTKRGTMVSAFAAFGFVALCLAFAGLELFSFLNSKCGAATTTCGEAEAPLLHSAAEVLPPLAAVLVLIIAVALTYHHMMVMGRHVAGALGNGRRSTISGLVMLPLCISAGTLEFIVFRHGQAAGGGGAGHGAQARALGLAALHALPAAATATFFLGMMLIIVSHVRAGGEGGGGAVVAGDGAVQGLLRVLTKVAAGMAAALVGGLMVVAFTLHGAKRYSFPKR